MLAAAFAVLAFAPPAWAQKVKDAKQNLDNLAFARPELGLSETLTEAEALTNRLESASDMDRFRAQYGPEWHFLMDERTGRVNLAEGGASTASGQRSCTFKNTSASCGTQ